ncbi:hypothetical protein ACFV2Z_15245 [Streptomyces sp. NPDC059688]|uniref:hypothetical protein n=1 Tax=Streptomyces sp. NPDC059688 TaxID=3346906 RepID=UPI0036B842C2
MTSASARVRSAALAAAVAGALTLTACSGGDSGNGSPSPSPSDASKAPSSGSSAVTDASDELQGSWITTAGGKVVALVITGKQAGVFATGGTVCSGTAGSEAGMRMIHLTCADGSKDRVTGMVDQVGAKTMKVTWSGKLGQETYSKAEGGKLPSGLPTAFTQ